MAVDREAFKQLLKSRGLKVTKQRLMVLEAVASCPEEHLTAEEIFELVKVGCPDIGLATVYRTIQLLNELRLVDRINFDDGFVRYEMGTASECEQKHHHHHLICMKCGKVISFRDDLLEELEEKITATTGFSIVDHEVKLYGVCKECGGDFIEEKRE
ncbi:MAG: transcriptional repressor [Eubacterium sp.]|nr:transcriptional repressor [Eubacterium sp.]MCM1213810.1 transcriptional repressor [Lachnospiraceae bacterium]MCM1303311.1 transcriptional repressor [Butyrivibrio sp.]MCM1343102.1 transcriptional repressor [Muribaculaceae bacterium]MCM1237930.1 transcriptional repressor [Lachnospiraceae bacterium]